MNGTDEMTKIEKFQQEALTKNKILNFINAKECTGASEYYETACKENNGLPPISWAEEVAASVLCYIQDDAEINIYFPNLPISKGKDGAHSTENDQQFSHEDVGASEARFNAEYDRSTKGEEGDDSGDRKDGGAEGGKGDDISERNHGEDDDSWEESSDQNDGADDEKEMENANPQNYQGNSDGGNKYQKDEGTERNDSADGNNGNGDKNDGGDE